jgi:hypothetical protein
LRLPCSVLACVVAAFLTALVACSGNNHGVLPPAHARNARPQQAVNSNSTYASTVLADNPSQYFQLNETGGPAAIDSSTTAVDGTYLGGIYFDQPGALIGQSVPAVTVNGGAYSVGASLPSPNAPSGTSYSIETWVQPNFDGGYMTIWGSDGSHRLLVSSTGKLLSQMDGNFSSMGALTDHGWHQVVFVYNASTSTASYYVDGKFDSSASIPHSYAAMTKTYYIGQYDTSANYKWYGGLAQHAFYRYALSASQVLAHYTAAGYPPSPPTAAPAATPTPLADITCNGFRWSVKTATDTAAASISGSPVTQVMTYLTGMPNAAVNNVSPRLGTTETTVFQLKNTTLAAIFEASDTDYHLLLSDGSGHTMIAEAPNPSCASGSALLSQITSVRNAIDAAIPNITTSPTPVNQTVAIEGVGFFDYHPNFAEDQAPNGIEIHPITAICFGTNCTPSTASPSPSPSSSASASPAPSSAYAGVVLGYNPVQYFKLNESSGPTAYDASATGINGTYVGSVGFGVTGPLRDESSNAISLPGGTSSAGVSLPNPNASGTSYTIETWVYPILGSSYMTIWARNGSQRLLVSSTGQLLAQFQGNFLSKGTLTPNQWHDVVFVYDAQAGTQSFYIDGALDNSANLSSTDATFNSAYYLGEYDTSANYEWHGYLAQHAFYQSALSSSQIANLYTSAGYTISGSSPTPAPTTAPPSSTPSPAPTPSAPSYSSLVLGDSPSQYFQLNELSGPTAFNSVSGGTSGTYVGAATFGVAGPLTNQSSTAISLPGGTSSAGVSLPNPGASGTSYSIVTWVEPVLGSSYMTIWGYSGSKRLLVSSSGQLLSQFSGNFFSSGKLSSGVWHLVAFVYNASTGTQAYYIDGSFDSSASLSASSAAFDSPYYLGQYDAGVYYKWNGSLAQQMFFPYALTASQISSLYAGAGY